MAVTTNSTAPTTMEIVALKQGRIKLRMIGQTPSVLQQHGRKGVA
jgi:hypothetical protein